MDHADETANRPTGPCKDGPDESRSARLKPVTTDHVLGVMRTIQRRIDRVWAEPREDMRGALGDIERQIDDLTFLLWEERHPSGVREDCPDSPPGTTALDSSDSPRGRERWT